VEPTIPQELIDEAEKEGFRLRPKYHHMKVGYVVSDKNKRTRIAHVEYFLFNAKLGAYYKQSKRFHYHDHYEDYHQNSEVHLEEDDRGEEGGWKDRIESQWQEDGGRDEEVG